MSSFFPFDVSSIASGGGRRHEYLYLIAGDYLC